MNLIHCDSPEDAFRQLLAEVEKMQANPLAQCWLVAPSHNWSDRVSQALARRQGIASGIQTSNLRALLESIAKSDPRRCLSVDSLALVILEEIRSHPAHADSLIASALGEDDASRPLRELAIAQALAEALDASWLHPQAESDFLALPEIRRLLRNDIIAAAGRDHLGRITPESFAESCRTWLRTEQRKGGPIRLAVLLDRSTPALLLERLHQLLEVTAGSLVISAAVNDFWADDLIKPRRRRQATTEGAMLAPHLLYGLGANAQDLHRGLIEHFEERGAGFDYPESARPEATSLLSALQQDSRSLSRREQAFDVEPDDKSLVIYSCRSRRRELEVIADQLRRELSDDPSLRPEDCRVLLVNPADYAPLVRPVFAEAGVPVHFPEMPPRQSLELIGSLETLLDALRSRFDLASGLRLLHHAPIARRFELEDAVTSGELAQWLSQAGVRWGRDAAHRRQEQDCDGSAGRWSWSFGLQRLGLGAILPEICGDRKVEIAGFGDASPLLRCAGLGTAVLAQVAAFLEEMDKHAAIWTGGGRSLDAWCEALSALGDSFFDDDSRDQLLLLRSKIIDPLRRSNLPPRQKDPEAAFLKSAISPEVFLRLFVDRLERLGEQLMKSDRMSGVMVSDLRKDAALPARFVAVAGLGADSFPRSEHRPDWHPLQEAKGIGLPNRRNEDRHFLLQASLCPSQRLILAYVGGSLHDDKELPPSTPLADLMEAIRQTANDAALASRRVQVPLHPFSSAAFDAALPLFARAQSPRFFDSARRLSLPRDDGRRFHRSPLPPQLAAELDLMALKTALTEPHRIWLNRLGLGWFDQPEALPGGELLSLNSLQKWALRNSILQERLASERGDIDATAFRHLLGLRGSLPAAPRDLRLWSDEAGRLPRVEGGPGLPHPAIRFSFNGQIIRGDIDANWRLGQGHHRLYSASKKQAKYLLRALVDALALKLSGVNGEFLLFFCDSKGPVDLGPCLTQASEKLQRMSAIHQLAGCLPLPFFIKASAMIKDGDPDALSKALNTWKRGWTKDGDSDSEPAEADNLGIQLAFAGISDPFTHPWELPSPLPAGLPPEFTSLPLPLALAQSIFSLVDTQSGAR